MLVSFSALCKLIYIAVKESTRAYLYLSFSLRTCGHLPRMLEWMEYPAPGNGSSIFFASESANSMKNLEPLMATIVPAQWLFVGGSTYAYPWP